MKKTLVVVSIVFVALLASSCCCLLSLAWFAEPLPTIEEGIASLDPKEKESLEAICQNAGIRVTDLRPVAMPTTSHLTADVNRLAVEFKDKQITGLSLTKVTFQNKVDFSTLPHLKVLWLRESSGSEVPDVSRLENLEELDMSGSRLPMEQLSLPSSIVRLNLSRTEVSNCKFAANMTNLRELDLSYTSIDNIELLVALSLEQLNASHTKIASLPTSVPSNGSWAVNLNETPFTNPPGYSRQGPGSYSFTGSDHDLSLCEGELSESDVDLQGGRLEITKLAPVFLKTTTIAKIPTVAMEVQVDAGEAKIWMREPRNYFKSPWIDKGKIEGFGLLRQPGWVSGTVKPGEKLQLIADFDLRLESRYYDAPKEIRDRNGYSSADSYRHYFFLVEPLNGTKVKNMRYVAKTKKARE